MKHLLFFQNLIEHFDPYGNEHAERVTTLSLRLAEKSGIEADSQLWMDIKTAALVHDVGKIKIDKDILRLPGKYLFHERNKMKEHPVLGADMAKLVMNGEINERVVDFILHHHEDWGGTGYPDKLKGEDIPIGSRIMRLPDMFDAMTNVRGYTKARSYNNALAEMIEYQSEIMFAEPRLLDLFIEMMRSEQ